MLKKLNIDNPAGTALVQYPVELILTSDNFDFSKIDSGFTSLRFKKGTRTLNYWIEFLDYANSKASVWVTIPLLPAGGTDIVMSYSAGATTAFQATSVAPRFNRPEGGLTLVTYPLNVNSANMQMLHPSVCKAQGWMRFDKAGDAQNRFWVMVNTPYGPTALLPTGWTIEQTECPALWVSDNEDPTTDNWDWPIGTANWPQDDSGDAFYNALHRVHNTAVTGYATGLHPIGIDSNLIVAPQLTASWSDPTMIWIEASQALRVYFRRNSATFPMYYCDITSPIDNAWSDADGVSHLTFTYGICKIAGTDWGNTHFGNKEALSPSVFIEDNKFYCVNVSRVNATSSTYVYTHESIDGISWTLTNGNVSPEYPTGMQHQIHHIGVMAKDGVWYMLGSNGIDTVFERDRLWTWTSIDHGATWNIQVPNSLSIEFAYSPTTYRNRFTNVYRPFPFFIDGVMYCAIGCASLGNNNTGETKVDNDSGGTFIAKDTIWTGSPQSVPNISAVMFMNGAVDFRDDVFKAIATAMISWPVTTRKLTPSDDGVLTLSIDGDTLKVEGDAHYYFGIEFTSHRLNINHQERVRLKAGTTTYTFKTNNSKPRMIVTTASAKLSMRLSGDDTLSSSILGNSAVTTPVTLEQRKSGQYGGTMAILNDAALPDVRGAWFDDLAQSIVENIKVQNDYPTAYYVYYYFSKPAYGWREPAVVVSSGPIVIQY